MGMLNFLFGKAKIIEDAFFGELRYFDSKDKTLRYFEGKRYFKPIDGPTEISIDADFSGPFEEQKQFFRQVEESYDELVERIKPFITNEFQDWKEGFVIMDFKKEFTPVHFSIPRLPEDQMKWELAFDTIHDLNHGVTIEFMDFQPTGILIDG
jgi:hypothetical protein